MKIAIIGGGISGLTAAYFLHRQHEITLFEANQYVGGHTNTIDVEIEGKEYAIDTGFIVFNNQTYPHFTRMLNELEVKSQPTAMSFSMKCDRSGLEYRGADLNGFFSQRRNLINPRFYRLLADILRFNRQSVELLQSDADQLTVGEYLAANKYSPEFIDQYFLPMGSAIWSCPVGTFENFPVRFIVEFYLNHGILAIRNRPEWRVICGGSKQYVKSLTAGFANSIRLNSPVNSVTRSESQVEVYLRDGLIERFDHVIFACHSDQALRILGNQASPVERELLSAFPYEKNIAQLHTDRSVLPVSPRAWACWNYFMPRGENRKATVTYQMNLLQGIQSQQVFCVTLNGQDRVDPAQVIREIEYAHPIFTSERAAAQQRQTEVINQNSTSFCGAYWGNGFHEDGVNSAMAVCRELMGITDLWKVVSIQAGFGTDAMLPSSTAFATESS
ncbi:FAD-dependent oxidoreductase [Gimesia sp.]|uniref:NAD(P)/FAD-dependent oxidoreductase n=1 Tax=Gimesia sp. TaxID=2024833 RepID=UPI000C491B1B|nr:FAD-dependent oxidoreductase [Gimesia sp.]MAX38997.1 FAD-dependent oxidoreductase [Gimesia sp.]HAH47434.1 FAD-dependent oxidoreductase [Planctomycetaceae bacterium]|tara:strand:- start:13625 stop:14959 length:1335 start_codon:yes stop_codon:yes gene_type:complete